MCLNVINTWLCYQLFGEQLYLSLCLSWASQVAGTAVKNLPASAGNARDVGSILGQEDPME